MPAERRKEGGRRKGRKGVGKGEKVRGQIR